MSKKQFLWISTAVIVTLLLAGCPSSGNGPSPSPTPAQQAAEPKQATFATAPRTVGHAEITDIAGNHRPADDDGDHCFKRDNSRDLVLTFTDPAVKTGKVSAHLIDVVKGVVDDVPTIDQDTQNGIATIRFSDAISKRRALDRRHPFMHLGPGPYVEVTTVDSTGAPRANAAGPPLPTVDIFPYITAEDPKNQCH